MKIFWGETHHNTYQHYRQNPCLGDVLDFARKHLDFYTGAYYTAVYDIVAPKEAKYREQGYKGVRLEHTKDREKVDSEWSEFCSVIREKNCPGRFITFPGYEWQGDARWGDHNVVYRDDTPPIYLPDTIEELYALLKEHAAIAIPHHTGYYPTWRAPNWGSCDDGMTPFAEVYSVHGSSESDDEEIGLRKNSHMGPGIGGATYQDALDCGLHLGAVASTDNWSNVPGRYGHGLMACLADGLTREDLWEAFLARRVYGVSGDRIELGFTCNGKPMGSIMSYCPQRALSVSVRGWDEIDRVEILRNGQLLYIYTHKGQWSFPADAAPSRFKVRLEAGWGPHTNELPFPCKNWTGTISLGAGVFTGWHPCWISREQSVPRLQSDSVSFELTSFQKDVLENRQNGFVFEFESKADDRLRLELNGLEVDSTIAELAERSRLLWYRGECVRWLEEMAGVTPESALRGDCYFQLAHKAKMHQVLPEAAYSVKIEFVDDEPLRRETNYRVRVIQRNRDMAWSSPIWVRKPTG